MLLFLLVFAIGLLNKLADKISDDGLVLKRYLRYSIGPVYGLLIAYTIAFYPVLAPLCMAVVISCIMTGKIDSKVHLMGIGTFFFFLYIFGMPGIDLPIFAAFFCAGIIDEIGDHYADKGRLKGMLRSFFNHRRSIDVMAIGVSAFTGDWTYIFAAISYDFGYTYIFLIKDWIVSSRLPPRPAMSSRLVREHKGD